MRLVPVLPLLALALDIGGCSSPSEPHAGIEGVYSLQTINGSSLPYLIAQIGADKDEITGSSLTIAAGGSFTLTISVRHTRNGVTTTESPSGVGTWSQTGSAVTLTPSTGSGALTGSMSGNTLTIVDEKATWVYRK